MKKIVSIGLFLCITGSLYAQQTAEELSAKESTAVFKKPLETVLKDIEKQYHVTLQFEPKITKGKVVNYADWRYRTDLGATLDNILKPLDMVWKEKGKDTYEISNFEYFRKEFSEGSKRLEELLKLYYDVKTWEVRKKELKNKMLAAMGINLSAKRSALKPIYRNKRKMDGYTAENVAFESIPGYFVCGTLYRPAGSGLHPVILSPHGHFYNKTDKFIQDERGRYRPDMQYRCGTLARMGAIVFDYDMYSYGESVQQSGSYNFHKTGFALALQTWNSIRALDFLLSLPDADTKHVGVTGASGGGTQTFLITALDERITASCPVVMVSASFYGGCNCESGLPIHTSGKTNNAEIAAMAAPKPQLVISDGNDWTQTVPAIEFPYLKKVYSFYNAREKVVNVHLPDDHHDYGFTKRVPMYHFFARAFGLDLKKASNKNGIIDEAKVSIEKSNAQQVFNKDFPMPDYALKGHDAIVRAFEKAQQEH